MKLVEFLKYLWDGVEIPVTKEEVQHTVNVGIWAIKNNISSNKDVKELNNAYKIAQYDSLHHL